MNTKLEYLIIGQGIAGSVLSFVLYQQKKQHLVIDNGSPYNASQAASGMCNPITGRRLVKTWKAEEIFPHLHQFYQQLSDSIGGNFWQKMEVFRTFESIKQQNDWFNEREKKGFGAFVNWKTNSYLYQNFIDVPFGGWETQQALYIDTAQLLRQYRHFLGNEKSYLQSHFDYKDLQIKPEGVVWKGIEAKKIIFCEGARVLRNPYFNYLPFKPDKGEWLKIKIDSTETLPHALKKNVFIIPLGNQEYLVSGTYNARELNYLTTENARQQLTQKLDKILKLPYQILAQKAGIRGSTAHRRPLIGLHPTHGALVLFNGFGTKGLSLSPYFAAQLATYLETGEGLAEEVDIRKMQQSGHK